MISGLVLALGVAALVQLGTAASDPLVAQIQHPPPGFKLRAGEHVAVRIRVSGHEDTLVWSLLLRRGTGESVPLARGAGSVRDLSVADLIAAELAPGETYVLELSASDGQATTTAKGPVVITDSRFALIPLDEGNLWEVRYVFYGSDASGALLLYAAPSTYPTELLLMRRTTGESSPFLVETFRGS